MIQVLKWTGIVVALAVMQGYKRGPSIPFTRLDGYLPKLAWDAGKNGPLLVVDPTRTTGEIGAKDLSSFGRKLSVCGTISAIVPINMVLIRDDLPEHNLFDGLDNLTKIFFLLATMTPDQLHKACGDGITPAELTGQTRLCLRSLIDHPFIYSPNPMAFRPTDEDEEVPESQLDHIGIKFSRTITFEVASSDVKDVTNQLSPDLAHRNRGVSGLYHRQKSKGANFGFESKSFRPNEQKKSDLNYAAEKLSTPLSLVDKSTIGEIVQKAGSVCGLSLYTDPRIASLPVESFGASAKAGDVLRSLALATSGTFRKVGNSYVLTSDLMGLGERQARYSIWLQDGYSKIRQKQGDLVRRILGSKALKAIGYDSSDPFRPDSSMASKILDAEDSQKTPLGSSSALSPAQRMAFNAIVNNPPNGLKLDSSRVGVASDIHYSFVLPDGRKLNPEPGNLGPATDNWSTYEMTTADSIGPTGRIPVANSAGPRALMVQLDDPGWAPSLAKAALGLGFSELWIQTSNPAVLQAATRSHLKVRFIGDPWRTPAALSDPDRDMIGGLEGHETLDKETTRRSVEILSPMDPKLPSAWAQLKSLNSVPNLSGLVIADTQPSGYEPRLPLVRNIGHSDSESLEFGYSTAERETFLKQFGVDPIDITMAVSVGFDITPPFFDTPYVSAGPGKPQTNVMSQFRTAWTKFRSDLNEQCSQQIVDAFHDPSSPPLIQVRRTTFERSPGGEAFTPLTPDRKLSDLVDKNANDVESINIPFTDATGYLPDPNLPPNMYFAKKAGFIAYDLRRVPQAELLEALRQWFVRPRTK